MLIDVAGCFRFVKRKMKRRGLAMATQVNISAKWLQSLESPESGRVYYRDESLKQLHLCVTSTGAKIWQRYGRVNGRMTRVRIGAYPDITVKAARDLCQGINAEVAAGRSVKATRRTASGEMTLGKVFEWYMEFHAKPNKRTWKTDEKTWQHGMLHLANTPLSDITRPLLIELVSTITQKRGPGAGNKAVELIRMLFRTAVENEWTVKNPAQTLKKNPKKERSRFLSPEELPVFFQALSTFKERIQDFFLLAIYTGARRSNLMCMRWDEIDFNRKTWSIPQHKSKNKTALVLPLADEAVEILLCRRDETGDSPWVFPSQSKTGHYVEPKDAWSRIILKAKMYDLKIHDLRRTLASWQAANNVSLSIIGKSLGHVSESATRIYARLAIDPVRAAVQSAINSMKITVVKKIRENS